MLHRMSFRRPPACSAGIAFALAASCLAGAARGDEEAVVECSITYEAADGCFVDAGEDRGVRAGDRGMVRRDGAGIGQIEVLSVSKRSALVRPISELGLLGPRAGDRVHLLVHPATGEEAPAASPTLKDFRSEEDLFTPLLAMPGLRSRAQGAPGNIFHGQIGLRELYQTAPGSARDWSIARLGTSGSLQRIGRGPWTLDWSGELSYRSGIALEGVPDHERPRADLFRLSLFRRFDGGGSVRAGRFIPWNLPAVGYLDGAQLEKTAGEHLRVGLMGGFKPTRDRLQVSGREPTAVPYVSLQAGDPDGLSYSGTAGLLASLFDGSPDRLSALSDQTLRFADRFTLYASTQVDFDVGSRETRPGTQLTQLDVSASHEVISGTTLRAGVDHYERLDSQAERDLLSEQSSAVFDSGFWRYWIGAGQRLPLSLTLALEAGMIDSSSEEGSPMWSASLTRDGLPGMPGGRLTVSVHNLRGFETEGYGGSVSGWFPLLEDRLFLEFLAAYRTLETSIDGGSFAMGDFTGRLNWNLARSWTIAAGCTYSVGGGLERFLLEAGITYRW